jgi:type II secretory pathway component PulM
MTPRETIAQLSRTIDGYWARLSAREQRLLAAFTGLLALSGVYVGVVEPLISGRARLEQRIVTLGEDVDVLRATAGRVAELERALAKRTEQSADAAGFSLFSFVDKAASASVSSGSVTAMNPSRRRLRDGEEENMVEVRLSAVPLTELVTFLREVEEAGTPAFLRRVELKRRYDDHTRFDATVVAVVIEAK